MAIYEGTVMRIQIGGKDIFHETDATFSSSFDLKELASKDTTGVIQIPGNLKWSLSASSLIANSPADAEEDAASLLATHVAKSLVAVEFSTQATGDLLISGNVYVSQCDIQAQNEEGVTGSFTFTGDGAYTVSDVA